MNLANKLTVVRIILIPFFLLFFFMEIYLLALIIYTVAAITDAIDGKIARSRNLITDFGKFLDPLADKILVMSALIAIMDRFEISAVAVIIILAREFVVTSVRLLASHQNIVIAADNFGKIKTVMQLVFTIFMLVIATAIDFGFNLIEPEILRLIAAIGLWSVVVMTVISGMNYLIKHKDLIVHDK